MERSLWRDGSFVLFWLARASSIAGSAITYVVLPILVYQLTGSAFQTALVSTLQALPYFAFGLFAGAFADRVNRRRLMVACDVIDALLLASIPLAATLGTLTLAHVYAVALLSASTFVWFDAANFGALPALAGRGRIVAANGAIWSMTTAITIIGPAVGGVLATTIGPAMAMGVDSLSFVLSAALILAIPRALNAARPDSPDPQPLMRRTLGDIREGLRYLWNHRLIRSLTLLGFGNSFTGGAVIALLVVYGVRALGLASDDPRIGLLFTAGAVGALLASLAVPLLVRRFAAGRVTLFGLLASPVLLVAVALAPGFYAALPTLLLWEAAYTLVIINGISLRQLVTPDHLQSRVNTTARMVAAGGVPFGAAVGGGLAETTSIRTTFLVMALGVATSAVIGWFSPLRDPRSLETPPTTGKDGARP